ncbi:hypothetical protein ACTMS0_11780 [Micromonospora sp. H33]
MPPTLASAAWISLCAAAVTFILTMVVGATRITHLRRLSRQRH